MDISGQVLSVVGRNVNTKFGARIVYDVTFANGKVAAVWNDKDGLATKAETLRQQGTSVDARLEHKPSVGQDGTQYDNYELKDITPAGQLGSAQLAIPIGNGVAGLIAVPDVASPKIPIQSGGGMSPERESKIIKQSSLATAFNFVGNFYSNATAEETDFRSAVNDALELAKTLYAEVYGQQNVAQTPEPRVINDPGSGVTVGLLGTDTPAW